jgi:proteic killer suppression protein
VIKDFRDKDSEKIFLMDRVKKWPLELQLRIRKKLVMLDAAIKIDDLRIPPSNHLEKLSGDRSGNYSIRVNNKWRICFKWEDGNVYQVETVDYH